MSGYTPGPWQARDTDDEIPFPAGPPIGVYRASGTARTDRICEMVAAGDGMYDPDVTWANANLLAAAPELLEALEGLQAVVDGVEGGWRVLGGNRSFYRPRVQEQRAKARAAIAKARGRA